VIVQPNLLGLAINDRVLAGFNPDNEIDLPFPHVGAFDISNDNSIRGLSWQGNQHLHVFESLFGSRPRKWIQDD